MLTPSVPHMHFYDLSDTCNLNFNGSTKFHESIIVFDSFMKGRPNSGSRMLCGMPWHGRLRSTWANRKIHRIASIVISNKVLPIKGLVAIETNELFIRAN